MLSFGDWRHLDLAGMKDNLAVSALMLGGFATHPLVLGMGTSGILAGTALSAVGGSWIGRRLAEGQHFDVFEGGSKLAINSSEPPEVGPEGGVHLGYIADTGKPLIIPMSEWMRHAMIVGQSGVGKTVMGEWIMAQQIQAGGGLCWIDGKLAFQNLERLWALCALFGREDDLIVVNPGDPRVSNTYNPCMDGDPDEIASRFTSLIPSAESNPGSDFYRQSSTVAVTTLVDAIRSTKKAFNFTDLRLLLSSSRALQWLLNDVGANTPIGKEFNLFLEEFRTAQAGKQTGPISVDKLRKMFGGMGSRLAQFGQGNFGAVMNSYTPEVRLYDCITQNKILYVMLPTMGKDEAARALGKMVIGDMRSAIARVQALPEDQRPARPYALYADEAGSYITQAWNRMFEQSRDARIVMAPAFQTKANLETLGEELRAMVAGNTVTKVFFSPGEPDTAEWMAEMIGKERQTSYNISASSATSHKDTAITDRLGRGAVDTDTTNSNMGYSESAKDDYKVSSDDLRKLGKGECIVTFQGHNVYHVKVPRITFTPEFTRDIGHFRIAHQVSRAGRRDVGLNMMEKMTAKKKVEGDKEDDT